MMSHPVDAHQLMDMVKHLGYNMSPSWPHHWLSSKRARGGPLVLSTVKKLSKSRLGPDTRSLSLNWVNDMEELWNTRQIVPHAIMPYDETRLRLGEKLTLERVTSADRSRGPDCQFSRGGVIGSLLTFFTIKGPFLSFLVLPIEFKPEDSHGEEICDFVFMKDYLGTELRRKWKHFVVFTKKGFMNSDAFVHCARKVIELWNLEYPGLNLLFLGDNLEADRSLEFVKSVLELGHLSWYLPANTSNWNAVPDDVLFALLKRLGELRAERDIWNTSVSGGGKWKWDVFTAFLEAEVSAFTPETCKKAFNNTGLIGKNGKFDKELVLQRIAENLGPFTRNSPGFVAEAREVATAVIEAASEKSTAKV
jgi:hypothetical protein